MNYTPFAQQVLEELDKAFNNWLDSDDDRDNPLGIGNSGITIVEGVHPHYLVKSKILTGGREQWSLVSRVDLKPEGAFY